MKKYKKLSIDELKTFKRGDKYRVHWCKDDDPSDCRLRFAPLVIDAIEDDEVWSGEYVWNLSASISDHEIDTSRGVAAFYHY